MIVEINLYLVLLGMGITILFFILKDLLIGWFRSKRFDSICVSLSCIHAERHRLMWVKCKEIGRWRKLAYICRDVEDGHLMTRRENDMKCMPSSLAFEPYNWKENDTEEGCADALEETKDANQSS